MIFYPEISKYNILAFIRDRIFGPPEPPFYVKFCMSLLQYGPWIVVALAVGLFIQKIIALMYYVREMDEICEEQPAAVKWCGCWANRIIRVRKQRDSKSSLSSLIPNVGSDKTIIGVNDGLWYPSVGKRHKYAPNPLQSRRPYLKPTLSLVDCSN